MNDEEKAWTALVDRNYDERLEEWGGDFRLALRSAIHDWYVACRSTSSGLVRAPAVVLSGLPAKTRVEAIDIPAATSQEAANPSA